MTSGFAKVFSSLWDGTLADNWETWSLFVFLLAHADANGYIDMTHEAISRRSCIPLDKVISAIGSLEAPDPRSRNSAEQGRRIIRLDETRDWGWLIVNYAAYRASRDPDSRKGQTREATARWRENQYGEPSVSHGEPSEEAVSQGEPKQKQKQKQRQRQEESNTLAFTSQEMRPNNPDLKIWLPVTSSIRIWIPEENVVAGWRRTYPAISIEEQFERMRAWLDANRGRRRLTARGAARFVVNWLSRSEPSRSGGIRRESDNEWIRNNLHRVTNGGNSD